MAHLHIPKPLHGWREFAGEVGIIVLGDRAVAWGAVYAVMPIANEWTISEQGALRHLRATIGGSGPLTTDQQDRLFQLIADLRGTNDRMTHGSRAFLGYASALGIAITPEARTAILAEGRRDYGPCMVDPARARSTVSVSDQYEVTPQARGAN